MEMIAVNGIKLAYDRHGRGTPVVFLHGYPLDHSIWEALVPQLENSADLILPDMRGFGGSEPVDAALHPYTVGDMAADVVGLLDALQINRAVIVGHSMGGYVALALAHAYPQRVLGLGLVSTQGLADPPERKAGRYATAEQVAAQGAGVVADAMASKLTANPEQIPAIRALILRQPAAGLIGALKAMAERPDSMQLIQTFRFPVAIVHGLADALIPVDRSREMKAFIPQAVLTELPDVGHSPMLEAPLQTAQALKKILA